MLVLPVLLLGFGLPLSWGLIVGGWLVVFFDGSSQISCSVRSHRLGVLNLQPFDQVDLGSNKLRRILPCESFGYRLGDSAFCQLRYNNTIVVVICIL